jgi:hypothetical protein
MVPGLFIPSLPAVLGQSRLRRPPLALPCVQVDHAGLVVVRAAKPLRPVWDGRPILFRTLVPISLQPRCYYLVAHTCGVFVSDAHETLRPRRPTFPG